jgi:hypothetical protein
VAGQPPIKRTREMQLEINVEGVDAVVSRILQPRNAHDDRQQADRDTGTPLRVSEPVARVDPGAEGLKVSTADSPGRVLLTLTPHGASATPAMSAHETRHRNTQSQCRSRQGPDARRRSPPDAPVPPRAHQPRRPRWISSGHRKRSRRIARMRPAYVRASLCTPSELPLCTVRICAPSTSGAYARALLAIGALDESVSLSGKTKPGR